MPYAQLDRSRIRIRPLAERANKKEIERDWVNPDGEQVALADESRAIIEDAAARIVQARGEGRPVMLTFGAHTIKNGLGPVLIRLIERGWVTHLATNGAGVIHDWEIAFQGRTSEDVERGIERGEFGHWDETGRLINLAINLGAWAGLGYGEAIGSFIEKAGATVPTREDLVREVREEIERNPSQAAAAADLLGVLQRTGQPAGALPVEHRWKRFSVQAAAVRLGVPFTSHPMFGHDIIYNHPMNCGALLGRAAERDFLTFAESVSRIAGGVYLSVGSAVMSPMVFEKSMSMGQNLALQAGGRIENHFILVVDLAKSGWDWSQGEPPESHADYYLRYNKTFSRMGGTMRYLSEDNRRFLMGLAQALGEADKQKPE